MSVDIGLLTLYAHVLYSKLLKEETDTHTGHLGHIQMIDVQLSVYSATPIIHTQKVFKIGRGDGHPSFAIYSIHSRKFVYNNTCKNVLI